MKTFDQLRQDDAMVRTLVRAGQAPEEICVALAQRYEELLAKFVAVKMICPMKIRLPGGFAIWRCPDESVPEIDTHDRATDAASREGVVSAGAAKIMTDEIRRLSEAIGRGGMDISPCMDCGQDVVCVPDGMPMCAACGDATHLDTDLLSRGTLLERQHRLVEIAKAMGFEQAEPAWWDEASPEIPMGSIDEGTDGQICEVLLGLFLNTAVFVTEKWTDEPNDPVVVVCETQEDAEAIRKAPHHE